MNAAPPRRTGRPPDARAAVRSGLLAGFLALTVLATGCKGTPIELQPEDRIPSLSRLKAATLASPMRTVYAPGGVDDAGCPVRLAVHEWGTGSRDRVVVLLHGVLSDSWTWRFVVGELLPVADVIAIDLPGCGQSDKPVLQPGGYSPTAMARRVEIALRARLAARSSSTRVALVGHSLGAAVAVRALADPQRRSEFEDIRRRVDRLVLISPVDVGAPFAAPAFEQVADASSLEVTVAKWLGILDSAATTTVVEGTMHPCLTPHEDADRLRCILANSATRIPAQAQIRDAMPWTCDRRPDWPKIEALEREYANVDVPTLVIYGARDETLGAAMGWKIASEIPGARLRLLSHSMHMLPSEQPPIVARLIREALASDGRGEPKAAWVDGREGSAVR